MVQATMQARSGDCWHLKHATHALSAMCKGSPTGMHTSPTSFHLPTHPSAGGRHLQRQPEVPERAARRRAAHAERPRAGEGPRPKD